MTPSDKTKSEDHYADLDDAILAMDQHLATLDEAQQKALETVLAVALTVLLAVMEFGPGVTLGVVVERTGLPEAVVRRWINDLVHGQA